MDTFIIQGASNEYSEKQAINGLEAPQFILLIKHVKTADIYRRARDR